MNTVSIFVVYFESAFRLQAFRDSFSILTIFEVIMLFDILLTFFKTRRTIDGHRGVICSILGICKLCREKRRVAKKSSIGDN